MTCRGMRRTTALVVTAIAASMAVASSAAAQEDSFRWSGPLPSGQLLEVRGISGDIRAELASGDAAEVTAEKHGRSSDFDEVEVRVERRSDGVTICAVYHPEDHPGNDCDLDHDRGDRHRDNLRVSVDFVVKVPVGVEFVGKTVSGDVEARDLRSDVTAEAVSGDVVVSTTGVAHASAVSGSLDVEMGSLDWRDLSFHTVSGDITLTLPEALATDVDFESVSGDLHSDFDVRITSPQRRRWVGAKVRGTIGDGGSRSLSLKTVSGDVRLRTMR